jgi:hypothetical protein
MMLKVYLKKKEVRDAFWEAKCQCSHFDQEQD